MGLLAIYYSHGPVQTRERCTASTTDACTDALMARGGGRILFRGAQGFHINGNGGDLRNSSPRPLVPSARDSGGRYSMWS